MIIMCQDTLKHIHTLHVLAYAAIQLFTNET